MRTRATLRLSLLGTSILALLGSPVAVVSQSDEPLDPMGVSYWTGFYGQAGKDGEVVVKESSGRGDPEVTEFRGIVVATDPRISGSATGVHTEVSYPNREPGAYDIRLGSGTFRIENDGGAWVGTYTGWYGPPAWAESYVLEGEGAYEGLTAVFGFGGDSDYAGLIVPGDVPPPADTAEPPAE